LSTYLKQSDLEGLDMLEASVGSMYGETFEHDSYVAVTVGKWKAVFLLEQAGKLCFTFILLVDGSQRRDCGSCFRWEEFLAVESFAFARVELVAWCIVKGFHWRDHLACGIMDGKISDEQNMNRPYPS
jgi:hypothetical protein